MKKITLTLLAMSAAVTMSAKSYAPQFVGRDGNATAPRMQLMSVEESDAETATRPSRVPMLDNNLQRFGTMVPVLTESFANLTKGSVGNPDIPWDPAYDNSLDHLIMSEVIWYSTSDPEYKYDDVWSNIKSQYIAPHTWMGKTRDWGGTNVFQAGGTICLYGSVYDQPMSPIGVAPTESHLNTPLLDLTGSDAAYITFQARVDKFNEIATFQVDAAETNYMTATWDVYGSCDLTAELSTEWKTYTVYILNGGPSTIFNIYSAGTSVYIKDLEVGILNQHVNTPVVRKHSDYQGTSFNANWYPVEGADSYVLTVVTYNEETGLDEAVIDNVNVGNVISYTVPAISGQEYNYQVAAVKGQYQSLFSDMVNVFDVVPPVFTQVSAINDMTYTAGWSTVDSAECYRYIAYADRVAQEDGPFVVTDMSLLTLTDAEGERLPYTRDNTWDKQYSGPNQIYGAEQPNWIGQHWCPYADCLVLCPFFPTSSGGLDPTSLQSGLMDLSKDGGKFTVEVEICCDPWEVKDAWGFPVDVYGDCVLGLYDHTQDTDEDVQVLLYYTGNGQDQNHDTLGHPIKYANQPLKAKWQKYTFNVDCGTEAMTVAFFGINTYGDMYFRNLKITQNYKKGESFLDPVVYHHYYEGGNQIEVNLPERAEGWDIYHQVAAVKGRVIDQYTQEIVVSKYNELSEVGPALGVESVMVDDANVAPVYYNLQGIRVDNPVKGSIYVKVQGNKAEKVVR